MKSDMDKNVYRSSRRVSDNHYTNFRHLKTFNPKAGDEGENLPSRESMTKRYNEGWGDNRKYMQSPNMNPITNALNKAVGTSWDTFFSELKKVLTKNNNTSLLILDRLQFCIAYKDLIAIDGDLYEQNLYSGPRPLKGSNIELYVDPRDGIIKRNPHYVSYTKAARNRKLHAEAEERKVTRYLDDDNVLRFIDGVWYHFELKEIPPLELCYRKPRGVEEFSFGYALLGRGIITKKWGDMNSEERARKGEPYSLGGLVRDLFTGNLLPELRKYHKSRVPASNKYHATKQTASHKMLKKAGIV